MRRRFESCRGRRVFPGQTFTTCFFFLHDSTCPFNLISLPSWQGQESRPVEASTRLFGRYALTGRRQYVSRSLRGGRRDADKALAQLVAQVDVDGPTSSHSVAELLAAHIDHLEGREAG